MPLMDESRKCVLAIVAGILVARHLKTADDLFGGPQGSPGTNRNDCGCGGSMGGIDHADD